MTIDPNPPRRSALRPGVAVAAFLVLALGFTAAGAVLLVAKAVLVDQPPYRDPARLAVLNGIYTEKGETQEWAISQLDFADWRKENRSFEEMSILTPDYALNLFAEGQSERLNGELVSYTYFPMLGVKPAAGRFFLPEEDRVPFQNPVAVLGYDLWQRRFHGDPAVIGRALELNSRAYTVVGVAPKGFRGVFDKADIWVPSMMPPGPDAVTIRRWRWAAGVGRLKPGVTLEQAQQDMNRVTGDLEKRYPDMNQGMGVRLDSLATHWFGALQPGLKPAICKAAVLLLLSLATAAVLLRGRASVGNAVALSLAAAAAGLGIAAWAVHRLAPESGFTFPSFSRLAPGASAILAVAALALVAGLLLGLAARGSAGGGWRLFRGLLVLALAALAVFLLMGAFRGAREYRELAGQDLKFQPDDLLTLRIDLRGPKWADDPPVFDLVHRYLDRLSRVDGVETLAMGGPALPTDSWAGGYMTVEDRDNKESADGTYFVMMHAVSPEYFKALGVPVVQGRAFTMADTKSFGVVVSQALAERHWPNQNPLGKRLKFGVRGNPERPWLTVLGVVPDIRQEGYKGVKRPAPDIYVPLLQFQVRLPLTLNFLVRPRPGVDAASLVPALQREMRAVAPDVPPYDVMMMRE
ncbi:MAG TPA: ABC transporter permease, partial [Thermoanaerobaculia bacterium]|nr:ABC transporter permease [Thermoanaerobaculia bacterium]